MIALLWAIEAWARVGGGQSFGTGSHPTSSSPSGGGGGDGDLVYLLLWLVLNYPAVGIPVVIIVGIVLLLRARDMVGPARARPQPAPTPARRPGLDRLRQIDRGFSLPVLYDYLQLVHRRASAAAVQKTWDPLLPFVDERARQQLEALHGGVTEVSEVVCAGIEVVRVQIDASTTRLFVDFRDSRREKTGSGERHVYVEERWIFHRATTSTSPEPERMRRLGCPNCGASAETDNLGACKNCGTRITDGRLTWQAEQVDYTVPRRPIAAPELALGPGGDEPSATIRTVMDPDVGTRLRALTARHTDFDPQVFEKRAESVYYALQQAWSAGKWDDARPYTTDPMYESLRFYLEQYAQHRLRNRLDDVALEKMAIVKVDLDAWYEAITVRIWGSMKDCVVDEKGTVVAGNARVARRFSEYWTFLRSAGGKKPAGDALHCPSCGAALDKVNQAGICGYCETKITTGDFDWVLSRIDQAEVWHG